MALSVKVTGLDRARMNFEKMQKKAENPRTIMAVIAAEAYKDVIDHFREEKGKYRKWPRLKGGGRWTSSKSAGKKRNKRTFDASAKPLQDTGLLRMSIKFSSKRDEAKVYTNTKYAVTHDVGILPQVPKRDFLYLARKTKTRLIKLFSDYMTGGN